MNVISNHLRMRWLALCLLTFAVGAAAQPVLTIPDSTGRKGDTVLVPVVLTGIGANSLYSIQATVDLGTSHATVVGVTTAGTLTAGASASYFGTTRRLAVALTTPVTTDGTLLYLQVALTGTPGQTSTLGLSSVLLNEGTPVATVDPGSVRLRVVNLSPKYLANVAEGDSVAFAASGDVVLPLSWSTSSASVGTIDAGGWFRAVAPGFVTVYVTDGEGKKDSTNSFNVVPDVINSLTLWIPDTSRTQTLEVAVPVRVTPVTGLGITSAQFRLTYNTSHLEYLGLNLSGAMAETWGPPVVNDLTPGTLDVALAGSDTLTGAGTLLAVRFRVKPSAVGSSPIGLANAVFNETINPALDPGTFTVIPAPLIKVNADKTIAFKGETVAVTSVTGGTPPFAYSSSNPTTGSADASTGALTILTRGPVLIQAIDAQGFPGKSDTIWTYDFAARIADTSVTVGDSVDVPLTVGLTDGLGIVAYQFRLSYDTSKVTFRGIVLDGTLSAGYTPVVKDTAGVLHVAVAGTDPLTGTGTLAKFRFVPNPPSVSHESTPLALTAFAFNEPGSATALALPMSGTLTVNIPNAPPVFTGVLPDTTVAPHVPFQFTYAAVDPDGDSVRYSITQGPSFAMIDSLTGVLTLAALMTDIGSHVLDVRATDGLLSATTSATVTVAASNNASLKLDGSQDRARVLDTTPLNPAAVPSAYQISGSTITVESWVYLMGLPPANSEYQIVARGAQSSFGVDPWFSYALRVDNYGGAPRFNFWLSSGTAGEIFGATADTVAVETGRWYHVAGTYDGTTARLYLDGVLKKEQASGGKSIGAGAIGFYIGGTTYGYFNGLIDEVRLWNVTRTGTEIAGSMNAVLAGIEPGLAGYWPLDSAAVSGANLVTPDATSNKNDLAIQFDARLVAFPATSTVQFAPTNLTLLPFAIGGGYAVTGAEYRSKLVGDGWPASAVTITSVPTGANVVGDSVIWTPAAGQFGAFRYIATMTNSAGSVTDTVEVFVEAMQTASNATSVDLTHRGKVGAFGRFGKGLTYGGKSGLYAADVSLVDRNDAKYAGGLFSTISPNPSFRPIGGFTNVASRFAGFGAFRAEFTDENESNRIGVRVFQVAHTKPTAPDDRYTIVEYRIVNESGGAIDDLFAQMTADFDIGVGTSNRGGYDSTLGLTYAFEEGGATNSQYYGFQLLGRPAAGAAVFFNGTDPQYVRSTSNLTTFPAVPGTAGDTRNQITAGPFALVAGETLTVAFAYHAASDLTQLQQSAQAAMTVYASSAPTFATVPDYAVPGAEYRRRVNRNGTPVGTVSAISLPLGATLSNDTLIWTPTPDQIGFRRVILEASNIAGTVRDTSFIFVEAVRSAENQVRLDATNRAKVGTFGIFGKGMYYKGQNGLSAADFSLVDRNGAKYAGGLYSTLVSFRPDGSDQAPVGLTDTTSRFAGFSAFKTSVTDGWEPNPIGVRIIPITQWSAAPGDDRYVIQEYRVVNTSGSPVDDLFAQMTADFDIGNAGANRGGYDSALGLTYAYEEGGATNASYYGFQVLNHPASGRAVFLNGTDPQFVRSTTNLTTAAPLPATAGDTRNQITVGPFALAANETLTVAVSFVAGEDLTQIQQTAQRAKQVYGATAPTFAYVTTLAVPGAEYRRVVTRNGSPLASVAAISLPAGAVLNGDTLIWTPTDLQLGFRRVILEATNIVGSVRDTTDILVEAVRSAENQMRVDLTNRGKVGAFGQFGKGIWYKGKNGSGAADFSLVDRNSNTFAGGLYSTLFSFRPDGPATSSVGFIDTTSRFPGFTAFRTSFSDQWEPPSSRIGVNVRMLGYVKNTSPDDRYVIVEYNVINSSGGTVDDLFAQMTADFDVGNAVANLGGYDGALGLSYAYEQGGGTDASYYGVALLSHPVAGHAVFVSGTDAQYVRSVANLTTFPSIPASAGDTRNQLTAGPFTLAAGDTLRFGVAFLAADSLAQLQAAAQQARTVWGNFTTSVTLTEQTVPAEFSLAQNYPNPFNPSTVIRFAIPTESRVSVSVYDQLGREVSTLVRGMLGPGVHDATWDATGMASGMYFYRIEATGTDGKQFVRTNKMLLMK